MFTFATTEHSREKLVKDMCVFKSVNIAEGRSKADFKAVLAKALLSLIVYCANDSKRGVVPMYQQCNWRVRGLSVGSLDSTEQ